MNESKTYVFGNDANNSILSALIPLCQQRGIDPNVLLSMRNGAFGNDGSWFIWVIFLFFIMGWGNNGYGGFGNRGNAFGDAALGNLINNDAGREMLMQAIQGNGNKIGELASSINCSIGQVQQAINAVMTSIQQVANQVGQSSLQVINAIQAGNCNLAS